MQGAEADGEAEHELHTVWRGRKESTSRRQGRACRAGEGRPGPRGPAAGAALARESFLPPKELSRKYIPGQERKTVLS